MPAIVIFAIIGVLFVTFFFLYELLIFLNGQ